MEFISSASNKITLRQIFLDNNNWYNFYQTNYNRIRNAIVVNVVRMLACRTGILGYSRYACMKCNTTKIVYNTCKSRCCTSCGKKATDIWLEKIIPQMPDCKWQHITFTMPDVLWEMFWHNRQLQNLAPKIAANIILELASEKGFLPGIVLGIHTWGRKTNRNYHIHLTASTGGIDKNNQWKEGFYHHIPIKRRWRKRLTELLENEYKNGNLTFPSNKQFLNDKGQFKNWISSLFEHEWVVQLNEPEKDKVRSTSYITKYLKRPPIAESRIEKYDGKNVTFEYLDHHDGDQKLMTLPVMEFIERMICHIPDKDFRTIRYYGFMANRVKGKLLPIVYAALGQFNMTQEQRQWRWRDRIIENFRYDPLACPNCGREMECFEVVKPKRKHILMLYHEAIATGSYP